MRGAHCRGRGRCLEGSAGLGRPGCLGHRCGHGADGWFAPARNSGQGVSGHAHGFCQRLRSFRPRRSVGRGNGASQADHGGRFDRGGGADCRAGVRLPSLPGCRGNPRLLLLAGGCGAARRGLRLPRLAAGHVAPCRASPAGQPSGPAAGGYRGIFGRCALQSRSHSPVSACGPRSGGGERAQFLHFRSRAGPHAGRLC